MATRSEIRDDINSLTGDANNQKWRVPQKNLAINLAIRASWPWGWEYGGVDGGTGLVTASGTLEYTPSTLTGITEEGILTLELEGPSSSDPYMILRNWEWLNIAGTQTIRLGADPTSGRKLRVTYRKAKSVLSADASETDLPEDYVTLMACYYLALNFIPRGAREDVQNIREMAPAWRADAMRILQAYSRPPPAVPMRQRRRV